MSTLPGCARSWSWIPPIRATFRPFAARDTASRLSPMHQLGAISGADAAKFLGARDNPTLRLLVMRSTIRMSGRITGDQGEYGMNLSKIAGLTALTLAAA